MESLAACHDAESKLVMYFTVNTAFVNYLGSLTVTLKFQILLNQTTHKQTLTISLQSFDFNFNLLKALKTLKDFFHQFHHKKGSFDLQKGHNNGLDLANKNSFFNNYTRHFLFVTAITSLVVTSIVLYIICKHTRLKSLVTSLALQQIREVGMVAKWEHVSITHDVECTCKIQRYTIFTLCLAVLGIIIFIILNARILKLFRGHLFLNTVKIMLFISDVQYYVPVKLCRAAESIHLFKIIGKLTFEHVKLKRNLL